MTSLKSAAQPHSLIVRWVLDPYVCAVLAMFIWALGYVLVRELRFDAPPVWLTFWRNTIGLAVFIAVAYPRLKRDLPDIIRGWRQLAVGGLLLVVLGNTPMTIALNYTTVVNVSIISAAEPMIIIALSAMLYHALVTLKQWTGVLLSLIGMIVLIVRGDPAVLTTLEINEGDIWCTVAIVSWSFYAASVRRLPLADRPFTQTIAVTFFGEILLIPWFAWDQATRPAFTLTWPVIFGVAFLGIIATGVALAMWNRALVTLGPPRASPFAHLMPVFGILLGIILLSEPMFAYHIAGIVLIVIGIYLTSVTRRKIAAKGKRT